MKPTRLIIALAAPFALAATPLALAGSRTAADAVTVLPSEVRPGQAQKAEARDTLKEAHEVVRKLQADPELSKQLQQAKGLFIVPNFGQAALGVGARGGEGVVLSRQNGEWSNPAFYNMGGLSAGAQAGAAGGQLAFLLMTDKAAKVFDSTNNFSLNANAGLSIADWSARGQASAGKGEDVIVWSDTPGLFAGANIGVTDIVADNEENRAFYGPQADAQAILNDRVSSTPPEASSLKQALAGGGGTSSAAGTGAAPGSEPGVSGERDRTTGTMSDPTRDRDTDATRNRPLEREPQGMTGVDRPPRADRG